MTHRLDGAHLPPSLKRPFAVLLATEASTTCGQLCQTPNEYLVEIEDAA